MAHDDGTFERIAALIDFPADFPVKVIGAHHDEFAQRVCALVLEHVPDFDVASVRMTASRKNGFLSLTLPLRVHSREQLQSVYMALAEHELVRIVI